MPTAGSGSSVAASGARFCFFFFLPNPSAAFLVFFATARLLAATPRGIRCIRRPYRLVVSWSTRENPSTVAADSGQPLAQEDPRLPFGVVIERPERAIAEAFVEA